MPDNDVNRSDSSRVKLWGTWHETGRQRAEIARGEAEITLERVQRWGLLAWLLKDASWVLLFPGTAWFALAGAVYCEIFTVLNHPRMSKALLVHSMALILWLAGNGLWMTAELLFNSCEDPGHRFYWMQHPLIESPDAQGRFYNPFIVAAQACFLLGLGVIVCYYAAFVALSLLQSRGADADGSEASTDPIRDEDLAWGVVTPEVYSLAFIGPWLLKDFFWTLEMFWPLVACAVVVVFLVCDNLRRYQDVDVGVELIWVLANVLWAYGELPLDDRYSWPRVLSGSVLMATACSFAWYRSLFRRPHSEPSERVPFAAAASSK